MKTLFVNAAFREGSRTLKLAEIYLKNKQDITVRELGDETLLLLDRKNLEIYNDAVAKHEFSDSIFNIAKEFAEAEEIVLAAPFWNFSIPAVLHAYIEMACTQGISFDVGDHGKYYSLCSAKKLTYITTAGGYIPEKDHAFGYIEYLAKFFWEIPEIVYIKADGLDIYGNNVDEILAKAIESMK